MIRSGNVLTLSQAYELTRTKQRIL